MLADHEQVLSLAKSYCTLIVQSTHCKSVSFLLKTPFAAWYFLSELLGRRGLRRVFLSTSPPLDMAKLGTMTFSYNGTVLKIH